MKIQLFSNWKRFRFSRKRVLVVITVGMVLLLVGAFAYRIYASMLLFRLPGSFVTWLPPDST